MKFCMVIYLPDAQVLLVTSTDNRSRKKRKEEKKRETCRKIANKPSSKTIKRRRVLTRFSLRKRSVWQRTLHKPLQKTKTQHNRPHTGNKHTHTLTGIHPFITCYTDKVELGNSNVQYREPLTPATRWWRCVLKDKVRHDKQPAAGRH